MKHKWQRAFRTLQVVVFGFGCAGGEPNDSNEGSLAAKARDTTQTQGATDDSAAENIDALRRENEDQVAASNAEWRSQYTDDEARQMLADMGLQTSSYAQLLAEAMQKRSLALSAEEENVLRRHFAETAPEEEISFAGRILLLGDLQLDADDMLERLTGPERVVDKGFGCIGVGAASNDGCLNIAPVHMRNDGDGNVDTLDFRRPDTLHTTYFIVADAAPAFFFDALVAVTARIEELNPTGDCLNSSTFTPIRQSAYDQLHPFVQAAAFTVPVVYGQDPCSNGNTSTRACSYLPSFQTIMLTPPGPNSGGTTESRLGFRGVPAINLLAFNTRYFSADTAPLRGAMYHELGHIMGRAHNVSSAATAKIPGTSVETTVASVMDVSITANRANELSGDDIQVIKTLYSDHPNRTNDACAYSATFRNFRSIPFNGCPPDSIPNGSQTICCAPLCGTCGGPECSSRPGSTDGCCVGRISSNNVSCTGRLSGPCVMP